VKHVLQTSSNAMPAVPYIFRSITDEIATPRVIITTAAPGVA
jgi:hypothetical protein